MKLYNFYGVFWALCDAQFYLSEAYVDINIQQLKTKIIQLIIEGK